MRASTNRDGICHYLLALVAVMKGSSMDTLGCLQQLILAKELTAKSMSSQQEFRKCLVTPGLTLVFRGKCVI